MSKWSRKERLFELEKYDENTGEKSSYWLLASSQPELRYEHGVLDARRVIFRGWAAVEVNFDDGIYFFVTPSRGEGWRVDVGHPNYDHFCRILAKPMNEILDEVRRDHYERYGGD